MGFCLYGAINLPGTFPWRILFNQTSDTLLTGGRLLKGFFFSYYGIFKLACLSFPRRGHETTCRRLKTGSVPNAATSARLNSEGTMSFIARLLAILLAANVAVHAQVGNAFGWGEAVFVASRSPGSASPAPGDDTLRAVSLHSLPGERYDIEMPCATPLRTIGLPSTASEAAAQTTGWNPGPQHPCTLPVALGQGQLSHAADWRFVVLACYGHNSGTKQSAATVAVVALLRYDGAVDTSTAFTLAIGTVVFSAATDDGTGIWLATSNGILYARAGRGGEAVPVLDGRPITHVSVVAMRPVPWVGANGGILFASSPDDEAVLALRDNATPWPCSGDWRLCLPRGAAASLDETALPVGSKFIYGHSFVPPSASSYAPSGAGVLIVCDTSPDSPGTNAAVLEVRFYGASGAGIQATPLRRLIFSSPIDFPSVSTSDWGDNLYVHASSPAYAVLLNWKELRDEPLLRDAAHPTVREQSALQYKYTNSWFVPPGAYPWLAYRLHGIAPAPLAWDASPASPLPYELPSPSGSRSPAPPSPSASPSASRSRGTTPLPSVTSSQTPSGTAKPRMSAVLTAERPLLLLQRIGEPGIGLGSVSPGSESGFGTPGSGGSSRVAIDLDIARPVFFDALDLSTGQVIKSVSMPTARAVRNLVTHFRCTQSLGTMWAPMHADPNSIDKASFILLPCYDAAPYADVLSPRYVPPVRVVPSNPALPPYMAPSAPHRVIARVMADMAPDTRTILNPDVCDVARLTSVVTAGGARFVVTTHPLDDVPGLIAGRCGFRLVPFGNTLASDFVINDAFPVATATELIFGRLLVWDSSPSGAILLQQILPCAALLLQPIHVRASSTQYPSLTHRLYTPYCPDSPTLTDRRYAPDVTGHRL